MRRLLSTGAMVSAVSLTLSAGVPAFGQDIAQSVIDKAQSQDTVRVIVRLNTPFDAQSMALEAGGGPQTSAIAAAQSQFSASLSGVAVVDPIDGLPLTVLELTADQLEELRGNDSILAVVEDELAEPTLVQSIPLIEANTVHSSGVKGNGQVVAILDTGVDTSHAAFSGKIVSQACYSTTSAANNSQSLCPGGASQSTANGSGDDCSSSISGCGHGTHVAGIAAGNGGGVKGVAPEADIVAIQVFSRFNNASSCGTSSPPCVLSYTSDQLKALNRVRQLTQGGMKIASANMSLGGGQHTSHCDSDTRKGVIDQLRALKVATVIASGNNGFTGSVGAPSCISSAITVGSTTKTDGVSGFSNHATLVDLMAPGSSITSARNGGGTTPKSGTSMATPHVAGAWALHKSKSGNSGASVTSVENKMEAEGKSVTRGGISKPRIDLGYLKAPVFVPVPLPAAKGPLAFGTVWSNGAKQKGYGNWSSSFNAGSMRYEVTISGQNYYYLNYATVVTPMDKRFCKTSSVSGKLLIYCYDHAGQPATSRFGFVTYKP